ncbi:MAG TPA: hypothetical protein V6D22_18050 [Candidatus Obscuribacterales bacterium]
MRKPSCLLLSLAVSGLMLTPVSAFSEIGAAPAEVVEVNASAPTTPFPHFWEHMFGSCRATLSLRESYRNDLRKTKSIVDARYVRFHGIFDDDVAVYDEDKDGKPAYNFTYVDQIYDGLLANGIRPYVELSFMPKKLASTPTEFPFWYKPIVTPPKDWSQWGDLISAFSKHLIDRYGIDEVSKWYFEVWNEPNIGFWLGEPKESTYYQLYDVTAQAIKKVNPRLRVGGPSTAQAAWIDRFIAHCSNNHVPVDFVSTHVYANDTSKDVFGTDENIPRRDMVARAVKKVHDQVNASAMPNLPIVWSEFNASFFNEVPVTDSPFMGPWLANTVRQCDGLTNEMSLWTFSDVFEEGGVPDKPFYGGFGLIATGSIPKAAFNAMALLHQLGNERLPLQSTSALATRAPDGSLAIAAWNYVPPGETGAPKQIKLHLSGVKPQQNCTVQIVDAQHGSPLAKWEAMGKPNFPTREQQKELLAAGTLPLPQTQELSGGDSPTLTLVLQPHSLALVRVK